MDELEPLFAEYAALHTPNGKECEAEETIEQDPMTFFAGMMTK